MGEVEIVQDGSGCNHRVGHTVHAEALQSLRAELRRESRLGRVGGEHPVVEVEDGAPVRDIVVGPLAQSRHAQQFLGADVAYELVDVARRALCAEELTGGDVEEGHAYRSLVDVDGGEEVVLAGGERVVVEVYTRCHKLCYTPLHELLGQLRVFELFADGHSFTGADQAGKICVESMMRESGQLDVCRLAVGAAGEGYAENFRRGYGVVGKSLVEVAHPEEQNRVGMFLLHLDILGHERGFGYFCHFFRGKVNKVLKVLKVLKGVKVFKGIRASALTLLHRGTAGDSGFHPHTATPGDSGGVRASGLTRLRRGQWGKMESIQIDMPT